MKKPSREELTLHLRAGGIGSFFLSTVTQDSHRMPATKSHMTYRKK